MKKNNLKSADIISKSFFTSTIFQFIAALASGGLLAFAFAPHAWSVLGIACPAILLWLIINAKPRRAALLGLAFGFAFMLSGVGWIYISIHSYGKAPILLAIFLTVGLALLQAIYYALTAYCTRRLTKNNLYWTCLIVFPVFWVIFEWLRGYLITGFPWIYLGYSQLGSPLAGFAPYASVYGVSFFVAMLAGCVVMLFKGDPKQKLIAFIIGVAIWGLGYLGGEPNWTHISGKAIPTAVIQGNISQEMKWKPENLPKIKLIFQNMTDKVISDFAKSSNKNPKLIIWPEASIPTLPQLVTPYLNQLNQAANNNNAAILAGFPLMDPATNLYYNGMISIGQAKGVYLKRHLVMFGEYYPLKSALHFIYKRLDIPMADFTPGPKNQKLISFDHSKIATFICYEITFPGDVFKYMDDANILLTITDDSWFGHSWARDQHLQMAQMRALETGRYLIFASNQGISAIVNPQGIVVHKIPTDEALVLRSHVFPMSGKTPVMRLGYKLFWGLMILLLIGIIVVRFRKPSQS